MAEILDRLEHTSERWRALFVVWGIVSVAMFSIPFKMGNYVFLIDVPPPMVFVYALLPIFLTTPKYIALGIVALPIYRHTWALARAFIATIILLVCADVAVVVTHFIGMDLYLNNNYWNNVLVFVPITFIVFWVTYVACKILSKR